MKNANDCPFLTWNKKAFYSLVLIFFCSGVWHDERVDFSLISKRTFRNIIQDRDGSSQRWWAHFQWMPTWLYRFICDGYANRKLIQLLMCGQTFKVEIWTLLLTSFIHLGTLFLCVYHWGTSWNCVKSKSNASEKWAFTYYPYWVTFVIEEKINNYVKTTGVLSRAFYI